MSALDDILSPENFPPCDALAAQARSDLAAMREIVRCATRQADTYDEWHSHTATREDYMDACDATDGAVWDALGTREARAALRGTT